MIGLNFMTEQRITTAGNSRFAKARVLCPALTCILTGKDIISLFDNVSKAKIISRPVKCFHRPNKEKVVRSSSFAMASQTPKLELRATDR